MILPNSRHIWSAVLSVAAHRSDAEDVAWMASIGLDMDQLVAFGASCAISVTEDEDDASKIATGFVSGALWALQLVEVASG